MKHIKKAIIASAVLATLSVSTAQADYKHTITGGYAKTNYDFNTRGVHPKGINLKYHFSDSENPLGFISSLSYTRDQEDINQYYNIKLQYKSLLVGPSYTFADIFRIYGLVGWSDTKLNENARVSNAISDERDENDIAYGAGFQFLIAKRFTIDASYERSRYGDTVLKDSAETFAFGLGWQF